MPLRTLALAFVATSLTSATPPPACDKDLGGISAARAQQVSSAFTSSGLVPDLVPFINPTLDVAADYNGKAVMLGNTFSTLETTMEPTISFTPEAGFDPADTNYTVFILDPDPPSPDNPILKDFLHLLKYNVKPTCVTDQQPTTFAPYLALTPLSAAPHRYTVLVYRQPDEDFQPPFELGEVGRNNFNLADFVHRSGLALVGGNYFNEGLENLGDTG